MSDPVMTLSDADLQHIGRYVRAELPGWLKELGPRALGSQLMESMVRVEEELKARRELLLTHVWTSHRRFDNANRRFDDANKRFDDANKRFDDVNRRFDDVNRRFDDNSRRHTATQWFVGVGFVVLTTWVTLYQFLG